MDAITGSPGRALAAGAVLTLVVLIAWLAFASADALGFVSFLLRLLHILGAMVWVGLIWFVNFVQLAALQQADDAGRRTLLTAVVPRVAHAFRHGSHLTLLTGLLLLVTTGYLFNWLVFSAPVYVSPPRAALLWSGVIGGVAMWAFVHFIIWPNLKVVLDEAAGDAGAKEEARRQVRTFARLNLVLALPVTFTMVAAAHLY